MLARKHLGYLDAFRAIAVMGVVLTHVIWISKSVSPWLDNVIHFGSKGVQLFFIISGLTLSITYEKDSFSWMTFLTKRFFRIAPLYYIMALFYAAAGVMLIHALGPKNDTALSWIATFTFLNTWVPSTVNSFVPGGWSISAEMMFYLCFPIIVRLKDHRFVMLSLTLASLILSVVLNKFLIHAFPTVENIKDFAYFFWIVQIPAFMIGICISAWLPYLERYQNLGGPGFIAMSFLIIAASLTRGYTSSYIVADLLFGMLVLLGAMQPNVLLRSKILSRIGGLSFSIYLIHFLPIKLIQAIGPDLRSTFGGDTTTGIVYIVVFMVSVVLSVFTNRFIETPGKKLGQSFLRRRHLASAAYTPSSR